MTIGKAVIALALLSVAACTRTDQLACGPALPPIATAAPVATPAATAPAVVAVAPAAPVAVPVAAAPLTPDQQRALAMQNRAAVAGR